MVFMADEIFAKATFSQKKITVPAKVIGRLGLQDGDLVVFEEEGNDLVISKGITVSLRKKKK